ncbi:MAG TPA: hypothetical protein DF480_03555 [Clostridiales bacterium]|nr:hypothetical protein [Clostridiales bacterium]
MHKYYVCRYYINAEHSVDNIQKNAHQHTFTLSLSIEPKVETGMVQFSAIDRQVNSYVLQYKGVYLNSMPQFQGIYPSLEWMGEVMYQDFHALLDEKGWRCLQLEIAENPLKTFLISDRIMLPSAHPADSRISWQNVLTRRNRYVEILEKVREGKR